MKRLIILIPLVLISILSYGQLLFNEVLYDPPSGAAGDANGDGTRDALDDEFIEFVNNSATPYDMSGFMMYDARAFNIDTPRHVFPMGTIIPANGALVLFGGGMPTGAFGGSIVQTASGGEINLTNSGDTITIENASGTAVLTLDIEPWSNNPNESYTRNPDVTGAFEQHEDNTSLLFSPGTKIDGTPFISSVLITSLTVQGAGGVSVISSAGGTLQMEAMVLPANASDTTVIWSVPAGNTMATMSASGLLTAMSNGIVYVKATANDASGIMDSTAITLVTIGIDENPLSAVSIYPNPAKENLHFGTHLKVEYAKIYSLSGALVLSSEVDTNTLNIEGLTSGIYLVEVTSGEYTSVVKLNVKQ